MTIFSTVFSENMDYERCQNRGLFFSRAAGQKTEVFFIRIITTETTCLMVSNLLKSYSYVIPRNVLNYRKDHFESGYFSHKGKDNWKVLCSMVRKLFRLYREEINLKVESSFSLNMTTKKNILTQQISG